MNLNKTENIDKDQEVETSKIVKAHKIFKEKSSEKGDEIGKTMSIFQNEKIL